MKSVDPYSWHPHLNQGIVVGIVQMLPTSIEKRIKERNKLIIVPIEEYEDDRKTIYKESSYDYLDRDTALEIGKMVSEYGLDHFVYIAKEEEFVAL